MSRTYATLVKKRTPLQWDLVSFMKKLKTAVVLPLWPHNVSRFIQICCYTFLRKPHIDKLNLRENCPLLSKK